MFPQEHQEHRLAYTVVTSHECFFREYFNLAARRTLLVSQACIFPWDSMLFAVLFFVARISFEPCLWSSRQGKSIRNVLFPAPPLCLVDSLALLRSCKSGSNRRCLTSRLTESSTSQS